MYTNIANRKIWVMLIILKLTDLLEAILLYLVYLVNKDCFAKKI